MFASLMLYLLALTGVQAGGDGAWAPATQATWPAATARPFAVTLRPVAARVRLDAPFAASVSIAGTGGAGVHPMVGSGRGLFIRVTDAAGREVRGTAALSIPPPPAPVAPAGLAHPTAARPLVVRYSEPANALFPRPGRYTVRSVLTVYNMTSKQYLRAESKPVAITVE
jgi:hypothetical protein